MSTVINKKVNRDSKVYKQLSACYQNVLEGTMISFDPSTGSAGSMPGYAIFQAGQLQESGIISVNPSARRNKKLFSITDSLLKEFPKPDVIIIENIPPVTFKRRGDKEGMGGWSLVSIQRAIGAIVSCFDCDYVEMAPIVWGKYKPAGYTKNDEWDAVCIGIAAIEISKSIKAYKEK